MAITINTNVASLNAQRNLNSSSGDLNKSMQRLSSGLRINSAKDDAAGLAISDRMTSQITGLNQAVRNANDGISLAQTAEGALQESTNILQRMRELSVQSANDTNTQSDRDSMQAEVTQLQEELNRIAETTEFNGKNLLDGSLTGATFQVGANAGTNQTISFDIASAKTDQLSQVGTTIGATNGVPVAGDDVSGTAVIAGSLNINDTAIGAPADGTNASLAAAINTAAGSSIASAQNVQTLDFTTVALDSAHTTVGTAGAVTAGDDAAIGDVGTTASFSVDTNAATAAAGTQALTLANDAAANSITEMTIAIDGGGSTTINDAAVNTATGGTLANWAAVTTIAQLETVLEGTTGVSAVVDAGGITVTSDSTGASSAVAMTAAGGGTVEAAVAGTAAQGSVATITVSDADAALVDGTTLQFGSTPANINLTGVDFSLATDGASLAVELAKSSDIASASWSGGTLEITSATTTTGENFSVSSGTGLTDADGTAPTGATFDITGLTDTNAGTVDTIDISVGGTAVDTSSIDFSTVTNMAELETALDGLSEIGASLSGSTMTITNATTGASSTLARNAGTEGALYDADSAAAGTYSVTLDSGTAIDIDADYSVTAQDVATAIDNDANFSATLNTDGQIEITKDDHSSFTISEAVVADGSTASATSAGLAGIDTNDSTYRGQVSIDSTADVSIEEVTAGALAAAGLDSVGNSTTTIDQVKVDTREHAVTAISSVDAALAKSTPCVVT